MELDDTKNDNIKDIAPFIEKNRKRSQRIKKKQYVKLHVKNNHIDLMYAKNSIPKQKFKKLINILAKTPKPCNCFFCRNVRKTFKEITKQEKISNDILKYELKNLNQK